jgi:hypothetical protein
VLGTKRPLRDPDDILANDNVQSMTFVGSVLVARAAVTWSASDVRDPSAAQMTHSPSDQAAASGAEKEERSGFGNRVRGVHSQRYGITTA